MQRDATGSSPFVQRAAPWVLSVTFGAVLFWAATYPGKVDAPPLAGDLGALRHLLRYGFIRGAARPAGAEVRLDAKDLQLGDVVLASAPGTEYGYFGHATAVIGDDEVLGQNALYGIYSMRASALAGYDRILVFRAALDPLQRRRVADFLRGLRGAVFQLAARKHDARQWHCAKAVWAAYREIGIDLAPQRDFIVPDDLATSPALHVLRDLGAP